MKRKIALWTDCLPATVDIGETRSFLRGFGFDAQTRGELFEEDRGEDCLRATAAFLAGICVKDFEAPLERPSVPSPEEVEEEFLKISERGVDPSCAYDGFWFQRKVHTELAVSSPPEVFANIVHTGRLLCTYGENRYHARVVVMASVPGAAQIISHMGVVEGPAKPPDYYWAKGRLFQEGFFRADKNDALSVLDEAFEGKFVKPSDPLMGRIVSAYSLQPLLYALTGKQFCENRDCSLFNSHRQSEVLNAQAKGRVCADCLEAFENS